MRKKSYSTPKLKAKRRGGISVSRQALIIPELDSRVAARREEEDTDSDGAEEYFSDDQIY